MKIKRNMIVWAELKSGLRHIQAGRRPCIVISCDKANGKSPVYTVVPGTTKLKRIIFQYISILSLQKLEDF